MTLRQAQGTRIAGTSRPAAKPARFAPDPRKRGLIAKIKIAQKDLAIPDDDYRAILFEETQKRSCADMNFAELGKVLDRFKARGWPPTVRAAADLPSPRPGGREAESRQRVRSADHPSAKKARALWISLAQLGVVRNPSEQALEAMARRQLGIEKLQWANGAHCYALIEALKGMAQRAGWNQQITDRQRRIDASDTKILKERLAIAQATKLDGYVNDHRRATIRALDERAIDALIAEQAALIHDTAKAGS